MDEEVKVGTREKEIKVFQEETYLDVKLSEPSNDWRKTSCIAWSDLRNIRRHFQWKTGLPVTAMKSDMSFSLEAH